MVCHLQHIALNMEILNSVSKSRCNRNQKFTITMSVNEVGFVHTGLKKKTEKKPFDYFEKKINW